MSESIDEEDRTKLRFAEVIKDMTEEDAIAMAERIWNKCIREIKENKEKGCRMIARMLRRRVRERWRRWKEKVSDQREEDERKIRMRKISEEVKNWEEMINCEDVSSWGNVREWEEEKEEGFETLTYSISQSQLYETNNFSR